MPSPSTSISLKIVMISSDIDIPTLSRLSPISFSETKPSWSLSNSLKASIIRKWSACDRKCSAPIANSSKETHPVLSQSSFIKIVSNCSSVISVDTEENSSCSSFLPILPSPLTSHFLKATMRESTSVPMIASRARRRSAHLWRSFICTNFWMPFMILPVMEDLGAEPPSLIQGCARHLSMEMRFFGSFCSIRDAKSQASAEIMLQGIWSQ
mmetsp:Transcript_36007/g.64382  ORF Transcript_36007/g.64382 Transcript_36007/m.64382 type:complete len:211 (-) Transcript_36007:174-806(-)